MIVSDEAFVMLLVRDRFKDFTKKELADPTAQTEAIVGLSADSREQVDELAEKALTAGGSPAATTRSTWTSCTAAASTTPTVTTGS